MEETHLKDLMTDTPETAGSHEGPLTQRIAVPDAPMTKSKDAWKGEVVFDVKDVTVSYGGVPAVRNVNLQFFRNEVTALIGPSGCGKSTLIRCLNRMNDLV